MKDYVTLPFLMEIIFVKIYFHILKTKKLWTQKNQCTMTPKVLSLQK